MKIGLLSDIHGNLPALRAVLNDMPSVELLICSGDIVGYYADPDEVCSLLKERGVLSIRGNHDAYVIGELHPCPDKSEAYRTAWTRLHLSQESIHWLKSLPLSTR